jgi:hypothetical protein
VNGQRVGTECSLSEGDVIEIAFTTFRFTRALPSGVVIAPPATGLNDVATSLPTGVGQRSTVESATSETRPPTAAGPIVVLIGVLVIGGIVVALAGLVWITWG